MALWEGVCERAQSALQSFVVLVILRFGPAEGGGLGENSFCKFVVPKSADIGWTEADHDQKHDKVVECALTSFAAPR